MWLLVGVIAQWQLKAESLCVTQGFIPSVSVPLPFQISLNSGGSYCL